VGSSSCFDPQPTVRQLNATLIFTPIFPLGRGSGLGRGVGVTLGAGVADGVGVAVAVGVGFNVGVGVGLGGANCAQYLPPVFKEPTSLSPPQTIISLPVQTAV